MRLLAFFLGIILLVSGAQSCRKPNYSYHDPCSDSTFLALKAQEASLNARDRERLQGLTKACEDHRAIEDNRGALWPYILGGIAVTVGALYVIFLLFREPDIIVD